LIDEKADLMEAIRTLRSGIRELEQGGRGDCSTAFEQVEQQTFSCFLKHLL